MLSSVKDPATHSRDIFKDDALEKKYVPEKLMRGFHAKTSQ